MFTAENEMDCGLNSLTQYGEHSDPSNVFVYVPLPVISVVVALFVVSTLLQVILKLVTTRNISSLQQPPSQDQLNFSFWIAITESKNSSLASDYVKCPNTARFVTRK